jgi:hypothetical protein
MGIVIDSLEEKSTHHDQPSPNLTNYNTSIHSSIQLSLMLAPEYFTVEGE